MVIGDAMLGVEQMYMCIHPRPHADPPARCGGRAAPMQFDVHVRSSLPSRTTWAVVIIRKFGLGV